MFTIPRKMEVCFFRHPSKTPMWVTIYVQISMSGYKLEIGSTGIKIPVNDWSETKKEVSDSNACCMAYNATLSRIKIRLINIFNELSDLDKPFSVTDVKRKYQNKFDNKIKLKTFLDRLDENIKERENAAALAEKKKLPRPKGTRKNTIKTWYTLKLNITRFLEHRRSKKITATEFDDDYYEDYLNWLIFQGAAGSSVRAHANLLKQFSKWLKRKKYTQINRLDDLDLPPDPGSLSNPITNDQLNQLITHRFKYSQMQKAADLFVVYCRTGFHFQDLQDLIKFSASGNPVKTDNDGIEWIYWNRGKTSVEAKRLFWNF